MNSKIIYVIDDDEIFQFMINRNLKSIDEDIRIEKFLNGEQAITALEKSNNLKEQLPDIIFLDINMPVMDGWEFLEVYRELKSDFRKNITIYLVSSSQDSRDISKAWEFEELTGYIVKPVSQLELKSLFVQGLNNEWLISSA